MARRRYQKPTPKKRGKQWCILVREDVVKDGQRQRKVRRIPLGPTALTRAEAERLRDDYLATTNQASIGIGGAVLFRDFARIYERDVLSTWASTTQNRSKSVLKVPSQSRVRRHDAEGDDARSSATLLCTNPAEKIRLRKRKLTKPKPFIRIDLFYSLLALIMEPYATMVYVAAFTGLRISELAGLLWRNVHADSITIEQRYCRGDWDEPKSDASRATIAVDDHVIERIQKLKSIEVVIRSGRARQRYKAVKSDGPDDLVFQSVKTGAPIRDNIVLCRHIKPAALKLGVGWVNWQVLRRSYATWMSQAQVNVKDAQGLMRHSRASTTQDVYQQVVPESQRKAVQKLSAFVKQSAREAVAVQ